MEKMLHTTTPASVAFLPSGALVPRSGGGGAATSKNATSIHAWNAPQVANEARTDVAPTRRPRVCAPASGDLEALSSTAAPATYSVTLPHPSPLVLGEDPETGAVLVAAIDRSHPSAPLFRVGDRVLMIDGTSLPDLGQREDHQDSVFDMAVRMLRSSGPSSTKLRLSRGPPSPEVYVPKSVPAMPARDSVEDLLSPTAPSRAHTFESDDAWSLSAGSIVLGKREKNLELAIQAWKHNRSDPAKHELVSTASRLIRNYGMEKEPSKVVTLYYRLKRIECLSRDPKLLNNVMIALGDCGRWQRADEVWQETDSAAKNVECYTTYIKVKSRMGDLDKAMTVIPEMRREGVPPSTRSYNALIAACVSCKSLRRARSLFVEMLYDGLQPDVVSWNILLNWHATNGPAKFATANQTFSDMIESGVRPNAVTFTTLIKAACRDGNMDEAQRTVVRMTEAGVTPDVGTYNQIIKGYADMTQWRKALDCFELMLSTNGLADHMSYALAVSACARAGQLERAEALLTSMIRSGFEPGSQTYVALLSGYARSGAVNRSYSLLREMRSRGCVPDKKILTTFMNTCLEAGEPRLAVSIFTKMKQMHISVDTVSLTLIMRAFCQVGELEKAHGVLRSMRRKDASRRPSTVTYNAFITAAVTQGASRLALSALTMMLQDRNQTRKASNSPRVKLDRNTYAALTSSCILSEGGGDKHLKYLVEVMRTLRKHGLRPSGDIYAALLYTCLHSGEADLGQTIMAEGEFAVAPRDHARIRELESRIKSRLGSNGGLRA